MATVNRINANYAVMQSNQKLMNLAYKADSLDLSSVHKAEKELAFTSLQNQLKAKIAEAMEANLQKKVKKDIERSFNTFA